MVPHHGLPCTYVYMTRSSSSSSFYKLQVNIKDNMWAANTIIFATPFSSSDKSIAVLTTFNDKITITNVCIVCLDYVYIPSLSMPKYMLLDYVSLTSH